MPPLPTSLSVVALVVAWLVVLVPMAARRREHVPDSDERSGRFRVLRRSSRRRKRPVLSRTAVATADAEETYEFGDGVDPMDEQTLWSDEDEFESDEWEESTHPGRVEAPAGRTVGMTDIDGPDQPTDEVGESGDDVSEDGDLAESLFDEDDDLDDLDDLEDGDELPTARVGSGSRVAHWDASDEWAAEHTAPHGHGRMMEPAVAYRDEPTDAFGPTAAPVDDLAATDPRVRRGQVVVSRGADELRSDPGMSGDPGRTAPAPDSSVRPTGSDSPVRPAASDVPVRPAAYDSPVRSEVDVDPAALRPVPRRPGRGGFDPEAAATAKAYRYRRRRRVTLILLTATVVFTLVSVFVARPAWAGAVVCGALLVGYLAYLRRQVRIEESIRQRRTARLAQARQLRPDYARSRGRGYREDAGYREEPTDYDGADYRDYHDDPRVTSEMSVPPSQYRSGTVVDLDDDDPAFSDLEYHQPLTYRRASGQ